jgi:hypothetical protein
MRNNGLMEILISFENNRWEVSWKKPKNSILKIAFADVNHSVIEDYFYCYFDEIDFLWFEPNHLHLVMKNL